MHIHIQELFMHIVKTYDCFHKLKSIKQNKSCTCMIQTVDHNYCVIQYTTGHHTCIPPINNM